MDNHFGYYVSQLGQWRVTQPVEKFNYDPEPYPLASGSEGVVEEPRSQVTILTLDGFDKRPRKFDDAE